MSQPNQQQAINIKPEDTVAVKCTCGSLVFQECFMMRRIGAIMSPTGKEEQFQIPVPVCIACGKPYFEGEEEDVPEKSPVIQ